jgi:hypothetical protein
MSIGEKLDKYTSIVEYSDIGNQHTAGSYQSRARAFFMERLASYLFSKYASELALFRTEGNGTFYLNTEVYGYCLTVLPEDKNITDYQVGI